METNSKSLFIDGEYQDAQPVEVIEASRPWGDFLLSDGTRLRVHIIVDGVCRLLNTYDRQGNPVYWVHVRTMSATQSPPHLIRRHEEPRGGEIIVTPHDNSPNVDSTQE